MFQKLRARMGLALWSLQKKIDGKRRLTQTQKDLLIGYYKQSMNIFRVLGIDIESKVPETQKLYHMMLLYLDHDQSICPREARTASLIGFLDSLGSGWKLPPTSWSVSKDFAEEVEGYMAMEIFRNHLGMKDIRDELANAIARFPDNHAR